MMHESNIYDNYIYASFADWDIEKIFEANPKKLEFNIDNPETELKKIDFNINVSNDEIDNMNDKEAIHLSGNLTNDYYSNIVDHETQHKRTNQNNNEYTLAENKIQSSHQLENQNETNDFKTTNKHGGGLVMAYNNNAKSNTLYPRSFCALYIGPNDNGAGHLIFKLSTKQILTTLNFKPVHMYTNLFRTINEQDSFTTNNHIDHFDNNLYTSRKDHIVDCCFIMSRPLG